MLPLLNCLFLAFTDIVGIWCQQLIIFYNTLLLQKLLLLQSITILITSIFKKRIKMKMYVILSTLSSNDQAT